MKIKRTTTPSGYAYSSLGFSIGPKVGEEPYPTELFEITKEEWTLIMSGTHGITDGKVVAKQEK